MIVMISRSVGRLTEYHLHQLQLPHPTSSSQLPFAIDAKRGEMSLLGGAHPEGELVISCHQ